VREKHILAGAAANFGPPHNKSLDASGGSVFLNFLVATEGVIRAAASTQTFGVLDKH
jgi:hypothetical protein